MTINHAIEHRGAGLYHVTDGGNTLAVSADYCVHCRDTDDGEGTCRHKDMIALADPMTTVSPYELYPDIDYRREAYYQAGAVPPKPLY